jgi:tetratricopeptide (TPR) repeat protein
MDADDFLDEDTLSHAARFEKMIRNKSKDYFDAETLESISEYYINQDKLKQALEVLYYGEELYPYFNGFALKKAEVFGLMGKFEDALEVLEKCELYEPFNPDLFLLKGENLLNLQQFEEAEASFANAILHADDRIDMLFEIAYVYEDCDLQGKAIEYFEEILKSQPDNQQARYEIANCYDLQGRFDKAADVYQELIEANPFSCPAWYSLGVAYSKMGNFEKAIEAYDYCLAIDEDFMPASFNKANDLVEMERYEEAVKEFLSVIEKDGQDAITFCNMASCLERLNRDKEAIDYYKKATSLNPNIGEAWFGMGIIYDKLSQSKQALNHFKRALLLEPENEEYALALADAEYRSGNLQQAEEILRSLIDEDPMMAEAWLDLSYITHIDGDTEAAINLLQQALTYDDHYLYYYRLACYEFEIGRRKEALYHLETALSMNFEEHFLIFEFSPHLQKDADVLHAIELFRNN